jgi:uncharacterized protein (TIGR03085 family)
MAPPSLVRRERDELCDLLLRLGPDAPTLCEGWTTADLAAHLVVRERDPRAAPGILLGKGRAAALTARLQAAEKARGHEVVVARVRSGPPWWWRVPRLEELANLNELFVHHEDVRRAGGLGRRTDRPELEAALWRLLPRTAPLLRTRLRGVGLVLRRPDGSSAVVRRGEPSATLTGEPSELALYLAGRRGAADVVLGGDHAAARVVAGARLGL